MKYALCDEAFKLILNNGVMENVVDYSITSTTLPSGLNDTPAVHLLFTHFTRYALILNDKPYFSENLKEGVFNYRISVNSPFDYKMYVVGNMLDDDSKTKSDVLLPHDYVEVEKDVSQLIYLEFDVPKDAEIKKHKATIDIFSSYILEDEKYIGSLEVEIDVHNVEIPKEKKFILDLWQHNSNIARKHDVRLWSDEHFAVLESYVKSLAELGQKSVTVIATEIPWRGQACYNGEGTRSNLFEYSMINVFKNADGKFSYDYSAMKRYIDLCAKYGIKDEIEVFGLVNVWWDSYADLYACAKDYPDYIRIRYYDESDKCYKYMRKADEIKDFIKSLETYFIENNLIDTVRISADEPGDVDAFRASITMCKSVAPSFKYKTAINHANFIPEFGEEIFTFSPYLHCACMEWDKLKEYQKLYPEKTFLWYVCCAPRELNTFLRSNLVESRFIGIYTEYMGFEGFLRWNYTVWPTDPRKDIRCYSWPTGDVNFVYPGYNGEVILTPRYKQLKRGIEDFEFMQQLKELGKEDVLKEIYDILIKEPDVTKIYSDEEYIIRPVAEICSIEPNDYKKVREIMLKALEK